MIAQALDLITHADIDLLVSSLRAEDQTIEFKQELPGGRDADKKEFLADVTSFANARGGDIVYGVAESNGVASSLIGFSVEVDATRLRLQEMLRTGIAPPISGIGLKFVPVSDGLSVLVLRIPRSWNGPHMVSFGKQLPFYFREIGQKRSLDVAELRSAFDEGRERFERLSKFRDGRLGKVLVRETPVTLERTSHFVVHVLSMEELSRTADMLPIAEAANKLNVRNGNDFPLIYSGRPRFNLDGVLIAAEGTNYEYLQIFRNGHMELVAPLRGPDGILIDGVAEEDTIVRFLSAVRDFRTKVGQTDPFFAGVTLLDVQGVLLSAGNYGMEGGRFDREVIALPEILITAADDIGSAMRPAFDTMWQAIGRRGSPSYDGDGKRRGRS